MATTGRWYINPSGGKVDFTDPSDDIDFDDDVTSVEIRKVETVAGQRERISVWKGEGASISGAEIAAAIADQDDAAVPDIMDEPDSVGVSAIANFVAITGGEAPTEAEFNALGAKLNAVLAALRARGVIG